MNTLLAILIVIIVTGGAIWIARESGLDARARGIPSIIIGIIGLFVLLGYIA